MAGLRQHDVAKSLGVSRSLISAFENNRRQPTLELTIELARTLGVTVDDLLSTVASTRAGRTVTVRTARREARKPQPLR
jgi:DNA-binding XRE family transcriptional regulator